MKPLQGHFPPLKAYPDQVPAISTTCSNIARETAYIMRVRPCAGITQIRFNRSAAR